jgi:hypothetical protein
MRTRQCNQLTHAAVTLQHCIAKAYILHLIPLATGHKGDSIRTLTMSHARRRCAAAAAAGRSLLSCAAVLVAAALCESYCLAQTASSTAVHPSGCE